MGIKTKNLGWVTHEGPVNTLLGIFVFISKIIIVKGNNFKKL